MNDWLKQIASGSYHLDLVNVEFVHKGNSYRGQGSLAWSRAEGVEIRAFTDGMEALRSHLFSHGYVPGQILPEDSYMTMRGTAQNGDVLEIARVSPDGHSLHTACSTVLWHLSDESIGSLVTITGKDPFGRDGVVECLLDPLEIRTWPRRSRTTYRGAVREVSGTLDWLEFDTGSKCKARQLKDNHVLLHWAAAPLPDHGTLNATRMAFSFLTGRMTNILAFSQFEHGAFRHVLRFPSAHVRSRTISPPLDLGAQGVRWYESLLNKISQFFSSERGAHFANLLYACMDSTDNSFTIHALVVCTMLEEIVMQCSPNAEAKKVLSAEQRSMVEERLLDLNLETSSLNRILGAIDKMGGKNAKNVLHEWATSGFLGITKDDVAAWDDLRNRAAHGKFLMLETAKGQKNVNSLHRICNLVNKLVLHACNYEGEFFDYVKWDYVPFPTGLMPVTGSEPGDFRPGETEK